MTAIITTQSRVNAVKALKSYLDDAASNHYLFIARPQAWADDNEPPVPKDTIKELNEVWRSMVAFKRIQGVNMSHVLQRFNWDSTGETIYFPADDDDEELLDHPNPIPAAGPNDLTRASGGTYDLPGTLDAGISSYTAGGHYVVTDTLAVYKCISNRDSSNKVIKSTSVPTGTSSSIIQTADGYRWKYMFTVPAADVEKFAVNDWIPVKTLTADDGSAQWSVQQAATLGAIDHVRVDTEGSGYSDTHSGTALSQVASNIIRIDAGASGTDDIYNGMTFEITSGVGAGERRLITDYEEDSGNHDVTLDTDLAISGTPTITILPTLTFDGDGSGAEARPVVSAGTIVDVQVVNPGTDYSVSSITVTGGGGSSAVLTPIISPPGGHGSDPTAELGARFAMFNVDLAFAEADFPQSNNYRIWGIATGLKDFGGATLATATTRIATKTLNLTSVAGDFEPDEQITSNGAGSPAAKVVHFDDVGDTVTFVQDDSTSYLNFAATETLTGGTSGATATIDSVDDEEVEKFSAQIIHVEYAKPLNRSENFSEQIKVITEF